MLLEIERLTQTPVIHMFDWIAGTSTGGILALGLGCGKTLRQCMVMFLLYFNHNLLSSLLNYPNFAGPVFAHERKLFCRFSTLSK